MLSSFPAPVLATGSATWRFDAFSLDLPRYELRRNGIAIQMEPQVFDVLTVLVSNHRRVVTKHELLDAVWGGRFVSESALTSRIKAVRRALGDDGASQRYIRTVRGRGYQFVGVAVPYAAETESESELTEAAADVDTSRAIYRRVRSRGHRPVHYRLSLSGRRSALHGPPR
ncbi:MAG: transcriptional regulator [Mycolicibacterium mageritense]|nr:MAG: transcriptional regulator [Mycolicibacterium mageritense]